MPRSSAHARHPSGFRIASLLALALLFLVATTAAAQDWAESLDTFLERELARASFPGAAVAVVSGDEVLYARGFGETRVRGGEAVTPRTSFEIGSLTKSMTALAILRLEERGLLELDDPVQRHLPWFRVADEAASARITLRHLLTHESGLPTTSHAIFRQDPERIDPSIEEGVRALASVELEGPPGGWFAYANTGYATLGAIVEAASGESWFSYVEGHILSPLGMEDSGTTIASQARLHMARPHTWRLGTRVGVDSVRPFLAPSGSMQVASARDMATYLQAWLRPDEGGVVTPRAAALATQPLVHVGEEFFGFGWIDANRAGERLVYHTGGTAGSTSYMALLPDRDLGVVLLGNAMSTLAPTLGRGIVDVVLGETPAPVGQDVLPMLSRSVAVIATVAFVLLALLARRVAAALRHRIASRPRWVLAVRAVVLALVAVAAWILVPRVLADAGLPAPFGLFGYPFDFAVGSVAILSVSTLWAIYGIVRLVGSRNRPRQCGRASPECLSPDRSGEGHPRQTTPLTVGNEAHRTGSASNDEDSPETPEQRGASRISLDDAWHGYRSKNGPNTTARASIACTAMMCGGSSSGAWTLRATSSAAPIEPDGRTLNGRCAKGFR